MTIKHMNIFIKVFQLLNITKASEILYMSQPAVTRAIKEIEQYYNIILFDRINHRIYPTEAGKNFYEYALHIVDSFNEMEKSIQDIDEFGLIRIGATIAIGNTILPKVLAIINSKYDKLKYKTIISNADAIEKAIINNQLDFGIIEGEVIDPQLKKLKIYEDHLIPILPPNSEFADRRISFKEVANVPLLLREKGSVGRSLIESNYNIHNQILNAVMESESTQAIINSIHEGIGISYLPEAMVKKYLDSKFVSTCEIKDMTLKRNNYLVWHKHKYISKTTKQIMNLFIQDVK